MKKKSLVIDLIIAVNDYNFTQYHFIGLVVVNGYKFIQYHFICCEFWKSITSFFFSSIFAKFSEDQRSIIMPSIKYLILIF